MKESVELPLTHPEYYEEMGIQSPKGVILYGEPGTGKTLLAKAVAHSTSATFIRATGSDLVQKQSGEGAKLVRCAIEIFELFSNSGPSLWFKSELCFSFQGTVQSSQRECTQYCFLGRN